MRFIGLNPKKQQGFINPFFLGKSGDAAYQINNSMRLDGATDHLTFTPGSDGDPDSWTFSGWLKLCNDDTYPYIFSAGSNSSNMSYISFNAGIIQYGMVVSGAIRDLVSSTRVSRDRAAWYHFVIAYDSTQATAADRVKIYVNSTEITYNDVNYPALNANSYMNQNAYTNYIGTQVGGLANDMEAYCSDFCHIDGQQLTPDSFGELNNNNIWVPKGLSALTYSTAGFLLEFKELTSNLGDDTSGNGNNFTEVGTPTQETDTPTDNQCVLNPLDRDASGVGSFSNGNLTRNTGSTEHGLTRGTLPIPQTGKWYWEITVTALTSTASYIGIVAPSVDENKYVGETVGGYGYISSSGNKINSGSGSAYGNTYTTGDVIGVAYDADNGDLFFYKNNTIQNSGTAAYTGLTGMFLPAISDGSNTFNIVFDAVFNSNDLTYTPPTNYTTLSANNIRDTYAITEPQEHFAPALYTGDGVSPLSVTGLAFQPDFTCLKDRDATNWNHVFDAVRGVTKGLFTNETNAEITNAEYLQAFNSDGFDIGNNAAINTNGNNYASWNWKGDGTSGANNTDGTITSTVNVNAGAGFSIVKYTGTGALATIGHGLGAVPQFIIVKALDSARGWVVYHAGNTSAPETDYLLLNTNQATMDSSAHWNDTAPTSSVFTVNTSTGTNISGEDYVAYCFAEIPGYSAFGSYTGNGNADGAFINLGFRPAYLLAKKSNGTGGWGITDSLMSPYNEVATNQRADLNVADQTGTAIDMLSNGFKCRGNTTLHNVSGATYIYMAIAEHNDLSLAR